MITRILTAIVALLLLVPLLIWGGVWGAGALFALVAGFSVYEMLGCCGLLKKWAVSLTSIAVSALVAILPVWNMDAAVKAVVLGVPAIIVLFLIFAVITHANTDVERLLMFITLAILLLMVAFAVRMFIAGGTCFLLIGHLNHVHPRLPLPLRAIAGAGIVTMVELGIGLLVNRDFSVWDYREQAGNFLGQICPLFTFLWIPVSLMALFLHGLISHRMDGIKNHISL